VNLVLNGVRMLHILERFFIQLFLVHLIIETEGGGVVLAEASLGMSRLWP